jgi:hypothetical protein
VTLRVREDGQGLARAFQLAAGAVLAVALACCFQALLARGAAAAPTPGPAPLLGIGPVQVGPLTIDPPTAGALAGPAAAPPTSTDRTVTLPSVSLGGVATVAPTAVDVSPGSPGALPAVEVTLPTVELAGTPLVVPPPVVVPSLSVLPADSPVPRPATAPTPAGPTNAHATPATLPEAVVTTATATIVARPIDLDTPHGASSERAARTRAAWTGAAASTASSPATDATLLRCCGTHEFRAVAGHLLLGASGTTLGSSPGAAPPLEPNIAAGVFAVLAAAAWARRPRPLHLACSATLPGSVGHPGLPPTSPD